MGLMDLFRRREPEIEKRAVAMGYTADLVAARAEWLAGSSRRGTDLNRAILCLPVGRGVRLGGR